MTIKFSLKPLLAAAVTLMAGMPATMRAENAVPAAPLPLKVADRIADVAEVPTPSAVRIEGWIGGRVSANERARLLAVDLEPLLAGFRKKPGTHPWIGEHIGKWMHAATLAWANSGDAALRAKLDRAAADLIAAQEADGYLGTYVPAQRFGLFKGADWDVWSHKYCMIGLLTHYRYTGSEASLTAARKAADLLIRTFPEKRSILAAGTHVGMAATSVLEPVVLLYRLTGEARYLDFARYIVRSWDEPKGPAILKTLLTEKRVDKTANGKAYEMLSNIVGLCDLARATGERTYIKASVNAWNDIVAKRLYITGSASQREHFRDDHVLPNGEDSRICETCVTTTWIQFNLSLLQLTGDAKYGDELERTFYNHLPAAQHPRGDDWCYYTALEGKKHYDKTITCCHSSGPRGMALVPQACYLTANFGAGEGTTLLVNTLETSSARLRLGGAEVAIEQRSGFPRSGESTVALRLAKPATFALKVRIPAWALPARVDGREIRTAGWAEIPAKTWKDGDRVEVRFAIGSGFIRGTHGNAGRGAMTWGPFVLACEQNANPGLGSPKTVVLADAKPACTPLAETPLAFSVQVAAQGATAPKTAKLLTYADAGADAGVFQIWLAMPGSEAARELEKTKERR